MWLLKQAPVNHVLSNMSASTIKRHEMYVVFRLCSLPSNRPTLESGLGKTSKKTTLYVTGRTLADIETRQFRGT
jgi:hypothetical protein